MRGLEQVTKVLETLAMWPDTIALALVTGNCSVAQAREWLDIAPVARVVVAV